MNSHKITVTTMKNKTAMWYNAYNFVMIFLKENIKDKEKKWQEMFNITLSN